MHGGRYQCPCCDYFTLDARGGYEVCPVCYWEDDGQDLDRLDVVSGPNHITLRAGRENFKALGACDDAAKSLVLSAEARVKLRRELRATFN